MTNHDHGWRVDACNDHHWLVRVTARVIFAHPMPAASDECIGGCSVANATLATKCWRRRWILRCRRRNRRWQLRRCFVIGYACISPAQRCRPDQRCRWDKRVWRSDVMRLKQMSRWRHHRRWRLWRHHRRWLHHRRCHHRRRHDSWSSFRTLFTLPIKHPPHATMLFCFPFVKP